MGDIGSAIISLAVAGAVIGATIATVSIYGLPWAWGLIKPLLHAATA